jgi:hypothetical protein
MSNETENLPVPIVVKKCSACEEIFSDEKLHSGSFCENCDSSLCFNCTAKLIRTIFDQPALIYPMKCINCGAELDKDQIEKVVVKQDYYEKFIACVLPLHWSDDCLEENEKFARCKSKKST